MKFRHILALGILLGATQFGAVAQTNSTQRFMLVSGSELTDDCPVCGRPTILVPMSGTFGLRLLEQNSLYTRFELVNIAFQAGTSSGLQYKVAGSGIYNVGGEVAYLQDAFLDVSINNGSRITQALCTNSERQVEQKWPKLQFSVAQTNGTLTQVYYLKVVAIPVPEFSSLAPDLRTGTVQFKWPSDLGSVQVERAFGFTESFTAVTPVITNNSFTDLGVLSNHSQVFYRLRLY